MTTADLTIDRMRQKTLLILAAVGLMTGLYLGSQNFGESQGRMIFLGEIKWITDYDQALKISEEKSKPVLIYFWRHGCPYCAKMETEVFPTVEASEAISKHFVPVALNIYQKESSDTVAKYNAYATPTFVIIGRGGKTIHIGYMDKREFLEFLNPYIKTRETELQSSTT